jgi:hypothetical protein
MAWILPRHVKRNLRFPATTKPETTELWLRWECPGRGLAAGGFGVWALVVLAPEDLLDPGAQALGMPAVGGRERL